MGSRGAPVVCLDQLLQLLEREVAFAPDVAELEVGVVVARVLVVDDRHRSAVVNEVGRQQIVVARSQFHWADCQGVADPPDSIGMIEVAPGEAKAPSLDPRQVLGLELEHVEAVHERLAVVEPSTGLRHPRHHAGPLQVLVAQRLPLEESDHQDAVIGKELDDRRAHPGCRSADAVLVFGAAIDGQLVGGCRGRVSEYVGPAGGRHLVVLVGQAPRERLDPACLPAKDRNPLEQRGIEASAVAGAHRARQAGPVRAATRMGSRRPRAPRRSPAQWSAWGR